jgi:hypothetical protein
MQNDLVPHGWTAVSRYQEIIDDFQATYSEEDEVRAMTLNVGMYVHVVDSGTVNSRPPVLAAGDQVCHLD